MSCRRQSSAKPAGLAEPERGGHRRGRYQPVAVPADRSEQPVREYEAFTADLYRLADPSVGSRPWSWSPPECIGYPCSGCWKSEASGVMLVDPRRIKNVPGRKTDAEATNW